MYRVNNSYNMKDAEFFMKFYLLEFKTDTPSSSFE